MKFSADVFEKGRENLLRIDADGVEYTYNNCRAALKAYRQYWDMKEWFKKNPRPVFYDDEVQYVISALKSCIAFLDVRDAIAAKHFPWGPQDRKRAMEDRDLVTLYLEKCRNPRFEDA